MFDVKLPGASPAATVIPARVKRNTYANDNSACAPLAIYRRAIQDVPLEPATRAVPSKCVSTGGEYGRSDGKWGGGISINEGIYN